ncbi:MAG: hypothetical protein DK841_09285 [Candidatus Melainabacteria bacterium]|nr:MAG: hypothetical protein DK841_09285 [Candidatus Melainabacteria bacterium]
MKKALTIGELLITMGIIGVIAMLTLPGFIQDYHKRVYTTKLKKSVEMIENAVNQACADNNVSYFYQTPYVNTADSGKHQQDFIDKYFKKAGGINKNPFATKYKILETGTEVGNSLVDSHGWAKLAGGEALSFYCGRGSEYCIFRIDINSTDGPNIGGRDFFAIFVNNKTNELFDNFDSSKCGKKNTLGAHLGYGCFAKLLENNWEMNY